MVGLQENRKASSRVSRIWHNSRVEQALITHDIDFVAAQVLMLSDNQRIDAPQTAVLARALQALHKEVQSNAYCLLPEDIDAQTFVDRRLQELAKDASEALKLGRSKGRRVATGLRLWLRAECSEIFSELIKDRAALLSVAERDFDIVMPGYAHPEGPASLAHWWLANEERLRRDFDRLCDFYRRLNGIPNGTVPAAHNRKAGQQNLVSQYLGFAGRIEESPDAISDRDYVVEFASFASLAGTHLSQLASDLLLWSTHEFGFIKLRSASSADPPPVERNRSLLQVLRSRPAIIFGHLSEFLTQLKDLPLGYCRDLRECVPGLIAIVENLKALLEIAQLILPFVHADAKRLRDAASSDIVNADHAVEFLVLRGLPQEQAAAIVQDLLTYCKERNKFLSDLELNEWREFSTAFDPGIYKHVTLEDSVGYKVLDELVSEDFVAQSLRKARAALDSDSNRLPALPAYGREIMKQLKYLGHRQ